MQKNILLPFFIIALAVASCACVDFDVFKNQINGLSITEQTKKETSDVIVVEDIKTLPVSPVFSDQTFRLFFTIRNADTERTVNNLHIELFDHSIFKSANNFQSSECSGECSIPPLGEKVVFFDLTAPSADEIVYIQSDKRISFRVSYDYETTTLYDVVVVNKDEIEKQQQAGKTVSISPNRIMGSGPVKIIPDLMGDYALLNGVTGTVRFILQNQGSGMLKNNEIVAGNLRIEFPTSFSPTGYVIGSSLFDKISEATGNIILIPTGMAITCSDFCGADAMAPIGSKCAEGCACYFNSECASGLYCYQPYGGEYGGTCQQQGYTTTSIVTTTTIINQNCHNDGCLCFYNSDCTSGHCLDPTPDNGGVCYTPTTIPGCGCAGNYNAGSRSCVDGCLCFYNSDCISGNCLDPTPDNGGICYTPGFSTTTTSGGTGTITVTTTIPRPLASTTSTVAIWNRVQPTRFFTCSGSSCTNNGAIQLFANSESSPLTFGLMGSTETDVYKVYTIKAVATYTYEIRKYIDVTIKPMGIESPAQP